MSGADRGAAEIREGVVHRLVRSICRSTSPVVAALAAVLATGALFPVAASAEPLFVITGRGWGHGVGMSQEGAKGMALQKMTAPTILAHYYPHTRLGSIASGTVVRVCLQADGTALSSWTLRAVGGRLYMLNGKSRSASVPAGTLVSFQVSGSGVAAFRDLDGDGTRDPGDTAVRTFPGAVVAWARVDSRHSGLMQVHGPSGPWGWKDIVWRGRVGLVPGSGSQSKELYAVNRVGMEDYLRGVVPRESPASWPIEALKAQAIAARGYGYTEIGSPGAIYDFYCTTRAQVYNGYGRVMTKGIDRHEEDSTDRAVASTAGQVVLYGKKVITAFFFSTSGGRTENIENVWTGSAPAPYLVSVPDPYEAATAPRHVWNETPTFGATALRSVLSSAGVAVPKTLVDVVATRRGGSDRVTRLLLKGADSDDTVLDGGSAVARFRAALGLWDTWFYVSDATVAAPHSVVSGRPFTITVNVAPVPKNRTVVTVRYGDARKGKLPGIASGRLRNGTVTLTLPGRWKATDVLVLSGTKGTAAYWVSPRATVNVTPVSEATALAQP